MSKALDRMQLQIKHTSSGLFVFTARCISGLLIGLTAALAGEELFGYGVYLFSFVIALSLVLFMNISKTWRIGGVIVFDLICVLVAMLLQLYIEVAPGG